MVRHSRWPRGSCAKRRLRAMNAAHQRNSLQTHCNSHPWLFAMRETNFCSLICLFLSIQKKKAFSVLFPYDGWRKRKWVWWTNLLRQWAGPVFGSAIVDYSFDGVVLEHFTTKVFELDRWYMIIWYHITPLFFIKQTSRPKARDGHRYPCPTPAFHNGSCCVSRAAALEGTGGDKVL